MTETLMVREGWYKRRDGYIVGPLLPIVRGDARRGAAWCIRRPYTAYTVNGIDLQGYHSRDLVEKVDRPEDPEAVGPPRKFAKRSGGRAKSKPKPATGIGNNYRVIVGKSVIKLSIDDDHVSVTGWDQPIPRSAIAGIVELLLEIAK